MYLRWNPAEVNQLNNILTRQRTFRASTEFANQNVW